MHVRRVGVERGIACCANGHPTLLSYTIYADFAVTLSCIRLYATARARRTLRHPIGPVRPRLWKAGGGVVSLLLLFSQGPPDCFLGMFALPDSRHSVVRLHFLARSRSCGMWKRWVTWCTDTVRMAHNHDRQVLLHCRTHRVCMFRYRSGQWYTPVGMVHSACPCHVALQIPVPPPPNVTKTYQKSTHLQRIKSLPG